MMLATIFESLKSEEPTIRFVNSASWNVMHLGDGHEKKNGDVIKEILGMRIVSHISDADCQDDGRLQKGNNLQ